MQHTFKLGDAEYAVDLSRATTGYRLYLDAGTLDTDLAAGVDGHARLRIDGRDYPVMVAAHGDDVFVHLCGESYALRHRGPLARLAEQSAGTSDEHIRAPMPGSIVAISVEPGDAVTRGQTLVVIESMKMETTIAAPRAGVVAQVAYATGQTFERDALLLSLESAGDNP